MAMKPNWFVGLPVDAQDWFPALIRTIPESCRPFHPEDLHLTLAFLGPLEAPPKELVAQLASIRATPITIGFGPPVLLPNPNRPSAVSLSLIQGHDQVVQLMSTHQNTLLALAGCRPDLRPPLPHVTIARPIRAKGSAGLAATKHWIESLALPELTLTLDRVALYSWAEDRSQRLFQIMAQSPL